MPVNTRAESPPRKVFVEKIIKKTFQKVLIYNIIIIEKEKSSLKIKRQNLGIASPNVERPVGGSINTDPA